MTKDEVLKLAQDACPYKSEELRGAFYEGFIKALDHFRGATNMIEPSMGLISSEWVGLTDDEEIELDEKYGDDFNAYIDARDTKLKEKNRG